MSCEKNAYPYKQLNLWKKAIELVFQIYKTTGKFPGHEQYGLASQIRRSAVSIPSNIAEGHGRSSEKELIRFLDIAKGSIFELDTQMEIAKQLNYIEPQEFEHISELLDETSRMLTGLRNSKTKTKPNNP
jgi:four helix bundle protein